MALRNAYLSGLEDRLAILTDRIYAEFLQERCFSDPTERAHLILRVHGLIFKFLQDELQPADSLLEDDTDFDIAFGRQDAEYIFHDNRLKQGEWKDADQGPNRQRGAPR